MNAQIEISAVNLAGQLRTSGLPDDAVILNLSMANGVAVVSYQSGYRGPPVPFDLAVQAPADDVPVPAVTDTPAQSDEKPKTETQEDVSDGAVTSEKPQ